jgi:hypothetical protein
LRQRRLACALDLSRDIALGPGERAGLPCQSLRCTQVRLSLGKVMIGAERVLHQLIEFGRLKREPPVELHLVFNVGRTRSGPG